MNPYFYAVILCTILCYGCQSPPPGDDLGLVHLPAQNISAEKQRSVQDLQELESQKSQRELQRAITENL